MQFIFLTFLEIEGANITWDESTIKSPELVTAAIAAGFTKVEVAESPLGVLQEDFLLAGDIVRRGARALIGINGSTLLEVTKR